MPTTTWKAPVSGNWRFARDWSTGRVPTAADAAQISASGTYDVGLFRPAAVQSVTLDADGSASLVLHHTSLTIGSTLSLQSGTLDLAYGTVVGGTIAADQQGELLAPSGTLDGVAIDGSLNIQARMLLLEGPLSFAGVGGIGRGTISLADGISHRYGRFNQAIQIAGTATLGNVLMNVGANNQLICNDLTIANTATVVMGTAGDDGLNAYGAIDAPTLVNDGTLLAGGFIDGSITNNGLLSVASSELVFEDGQVANAGSLEITGGMVRVEDGSFINGGTISIDNQSTFQVDQAFTNTGTVLNAGVIVETEALTTQELLAQAVHITSVDGGLIQIEGTLDNRNATLDLGPGTALGTLALGYSFLAHFQDPTAGEILGGTIIDPGGGLQISGETLDGVTYLGTLVLAGGTFNGEPQAGGAFIENGLTLTGLDGSGRGTIDNNGSRTALIFTGSATLANAVVEFGNVAGATIVGDSLALADTTTIIETGVAAEIEANTIINNGYIIGKDLSGATLSIQTDYPASGSFINSGVIIANYGDITIGAATVANTGHIYLYNGSIITFSGTIATAGIGSITIGKGSVNLGVVNNTGTTLTVGVGSMLGTPGIGTIIGGTLQTSTSAPVALGIGGLQSATLRGDFDISTSIEVSGGLTMAGFSGIGAGGLSLINELYTQGNMAISNANIVASGVGVDGIWSGGTLTLDATTSYAMPASLYALLGQELINLGTIETSSPTGNGYYFIDMADLYNEGLIAMTQHATLDVMSAAPDTGAPTTFFNTGDLQATNGGDILFEGTLAGLNGGTLSAGTYDMGAGSTLYLTVNGPIDVVGGDVVLRGSGSAIHTYGGVAIDQTLSGVSAGGTLALLDGRSMTLGTGTLAVGGVVSLDGGTLLTGATSVAAGGTIAGTGTIGGAITAAGLITISAGTFGMTFLGGMQNTGTIIDGGSVLFQGSLTGAGLLQVGAGDTATLGGLAGSAQTIDLEGAGRLDLGQPGSIYASIADFAGGATIDLLATQATGSIVSGNHLAVIDNGATVANLAFSGGSVLSGITLQSDGAGGTLIAHQPT